MNKLSEPSVALLPPDAIDRRSYHVFEEHGSRLLFDRAMGVVAEVDAFLYTLLEAYGRGAEMEEAYKISREACSSVSLADVYEMIYSLQQRGFFRYIPVDMPEQRRILEGYLHHKPKRIQLLMAQSCNLGCRYCYAWRNGSNQKNTLMSWTVAKRAVDFLVERSGNRKDLQVTFFGGEPLLNYSTIQQVVEYCESTKDKLGKSFTYEIITNATLLTKEVANYLADNRFLVMVSIDGWREMHNYNRPSLQGRDEYDEILENAVYANELFKSRKLVDIKVRANLTSKYHDADGVRRYLHNLGFRKIGISPIEPLSHSEPSPSSLSEDESDALQLREFEIDVASVNRIKSGLPVEHVRSKHVLDRCSSLQPSLLKGINCGVTRNTAVVDNKGDIFPCHRYEGMQNYVVGNVFTGMDKEKTMTYYLKVNGNATARCHSCWIRDYCAGGCSWLLSRKDGTIVDPTVRECDRRRRSMEHTLFLRSQLRDVLPSAFAASNNRELLEWDWKQTAAEGSCGSCETCSEGCGS